MTIRTVTESLSAVTVDAGVTQWAHADQHFADHGIHIQVRRSEVGGNVSLNTEAVLKDSGRLIASDCLTRLAFDGVHRYLAALKHAV